MRTKLESAVVAGMETAASQPMRWGTDDCAVWCADILRSQLGYDPIAEWRGRYRTRRGAMRVLKGHGLAKAIRATARRHGWKRIDPRLAQPGDVGLVWMEIESKRTLSIVICRKRGWFVVRTLNGFTLIPADKAVLAWSVLPDALPNSAPRVHVPKAVHDPISDLIGLSALINFVVGGTAVVGGVGAVVGGAILTVGVSQGVSFR